ncbi:peptidase C65 Otubain-domain-containing protein [Melampsora americana]|nr:peptidase C65 Otubain-domain-containing protein [Melampsora americana]
MAAEETTVDVNTKLSDLTDRQILELTQGIKDQESKSKPLVSKLESLDTLRTEYEQSQNDSSINYVKKIRWLKTQKWTSFRRLRGDGNCFYRAFGYGLCERLLVLQGESVLGVMSKSDSDSTGREANQNRAKAMLSRFEGLLPLLDQAGYEKIIYEDFWEPFQNILKSISEGRMKKIEELLLAFNDQETCANIIIFLRLLTSAYLKHHEDDFAPFLLSFEEDYERFPAGAPTLIEFCQFYVEAVDKDADHLSITALTRCLKVDLSIAYLDLSIGHFGHVNQSGSDNSEMLPVDFHRFETQDVEVKDLWTDVALLYRPGHYDLIYQEP